MIFGSMINPIKIRIAGEYRASRYGNQTFRSDGNINEKWENSVAMRRAIT
jgi:hypothetical protein